MLAAVAVAAGLVLLLLASSLEDLMIGAGVTVMSILLFLGWLVSIDAAERVPGAGSGSSRSRPDRTSITRSLTAHPRQGGEPAAGAEKRRGRLARGSD